MKKLAQLFLDEKHHAPVHPQIAGRKEQRSHSPSSPNRSVLLGGGAILCFTLLVLSIIFSGPSSGGNPIVVDPVTLCPISHHNLAHETYIHIDLSEKLTKEQRGWLQSLLTVAQNNKLPVHSLISISQMQTVSKAPRVEVQRFCIPEISEIGAAGRSVTRDDCEATATDEFWKQRKVRHVARNLREKITAACKSYLDMTTRIQQSAARYKNVSLEQDYSYIVGSIEDILHASKHAGDSRVPTRLIIFSDMLQNANWFSQYKTPPDDWTIGNLEELRNSGQATKEIGGKPPPADLKFNQVLLCAIPSWYPVLASARSQNAHAAMWKDYFALRIVRPSRKNFQFIAASGCAQAATGLMQGG